MEVADATVSNFADAFLAVQKISEELSAELAETPSAEVAQSLQREAQNEMAQAVEEAGISVKEYNDIAVGMKGDPMLAERVETAINENR